VALFGIVAGYFVKEAVTHPVYEHIPHGDEPGLLG
jgi:hypothetical protein